MTLGSRRELRPTNANVRAAAVNVDAGRLGGPCKRVGERSANRIREGDMRDDSVFEKGRWPSRGRIDELIDDDEVAGSDLLSHRSDGAHAEKVCRPEHLESADVRSIVDDVRRKVVLSPMPREKQDGRVAQPTAKDGVARRSEGSLDGRFHDVGQPVDLVQTAA